MQNIKKKRLTNIRLNFDFIICRKTLQCTEHSFEPIHKYRQLQVLTSQVNFCYRGTALPFVLLLAMTGSIWGTHLTISLHHKLLEHVGNAIFPFYSLAGTTSIVILGSMAGFINTKSRQCISKLGKVSELQGRKFLSIESFKIWRKMVKSCAPLKIRCKSNFMEMKTPLVMASFCTKSTVRLLLTQ